MFDLKQEQFAVGTETWSIVLDNPVRTECKIFFRYSPVQHETGWYWQVEDVDENGPFDSFYEAAHDAEEPFN